jgi:hypothetical protein
MVVVEVFGGDRLHGFIHSFHGVSVVRGEELRGDFAKSLDIGGYVWGGSSVRLV